MLSLGLGGLVVLVVVGWFGGALLFIALRAVVLVCCAIVLLPVRLVAWFGRLAAHLAAYRRQL